MEGRALEHCSGISLPCFMIQLGVSSVGASLVRENRLADPTDNTLRHQFEFVMIAIWISVPP